MDLCLVLVLEGTMYFSLFRFFHVLFGFVIIVAIAVRKSTFLVRLIFLGSPLSIFFLFFGIVFIRRGNATLFK